MKLCDLPNDVLLGVFQATVTKAEHLSPFNRDDLQLLAVCRQWRVLALGIVYSGMFLEYDKDKRRMSTNIGLVAAAGVVHLVRHVHITFYRAPARPQDVERLMTTMRITAHQWPGVRELTIDARRPRDYGSRGSSDVAPHGDEMNSLCAVLGSLMPGIRRLEFPRFQDSRLVKALYGRLASIYAGQLNVLYCPENAQVPQTCHFSQLQLGNIDLGYEEHHLFRIDPATLVKLTLLGVDPSTSWALFSNSSGSPDIVFPVLQWLSLGFRVPYVDPPAIPKYEECPWQLHFPRLRSLRLGSDDNPIPSLDCLLLPRRLDHLHLSVLSDQLSEIEDMAFPICRDQILVIHHPRDDDRQCLFAPVNRIMAAAHQRDNARLFVCDDTMAIRPSNLTCTGLTELYFVADTTLDDVFALIEKLPRLVCMGVTGLCLRHKMDGVAIPKRGAHLEPLKTKLQRLSIGFNRMHSSRKQDILATKFLLLKILTLSELCTVEYTLESAIAFAKRYSRWYPHLATIAFWHQEY